MSRTQTTCAIASLARGKVTKEGHFLDYRGVPRYGIGQRISYRQRGGQWQVREERRIAAASARDEDFASWKRRMDLQTKGLGDRTISIDIEHDPYGEEGVRIIIAGWRPAEAREVKKIERQRGSKRDDKGGHASRKVVR